MQKQLNPELFSERRSIQSPGNSVHPAGGSAQDPAAFLNVDRQIFELKTQMMGIGEEIKKISAQTQEFMKVTHLKMERLQQQLHRLEQGHNGFVQESAHKVGQLGQRIAERKSLDQKIQDMVDRHTNVIKSFEVRMNHLQRLLAEKEAQAMQAQTALNETRMELSRLKRL